MVVRKFNITLLPLQGSQHYTMALVDISNPNYVQIKPDNTKIRRIILFKKNLRENQQTTKKLTTHSQIFYSFNRLNKYEKSLDNNDYHSLHSFNNMDLYITSMLKNYSFKYILSTYSSTSS
jgi:hypothetical protein